MAARDDESPVRCGSSRHQDHPVETPEANLAPDFAGCTAKQSACQWQMMYFGRPETDTFTFYPETGVVFRTHAVFNVSNYADPYVMAVQQDLYEVRERCA